MAGFRPWTSRNQPEKSFVWTRIFPTTCGWINARGHPCRVLAETSPGNICALGEVPCSRRLISGGSAADVPLGFESLDANGGPAARSADALGAAAENRSASLPRTAQPRTHNHRPLAVSMP